MKLRAESHGHSYLLEIVSDDRSNLDGGKNISYTLRSLEEEDPVPTTAGTASVMEVMPGVFSVLIGHESLLIRLSPALDDTLNISLGTQRFSVALGDLRDQAPRNTVAAHTGPHELRALMPGKVVKILVAPGESVSLGQGVIIVEAMKMQNEMKSPKNGMVSRVTTSEGETVAAGATLLVIE